MAEGRKHSFTTTLQLLPRPTHILPRVISSLVFTRVQSGLLGHYWAGLIDLLTEGGEIEETTNHFVLS